MSHVYLSFNENQRDLLNQAITGTDGKAIPMPYSDLVLEIEEEDLGLIPEIACQVRVLGTNAGVNTGIANTKKLINSFADRVYLKFEPYSQSIRNQINANDKFFFDPNAKKHYVKKEDLNDYNVRKLLKFCFNKHPILATDFNSKPLTLGKIDLANALNWTCSYEQPTLIARALISCFEEHKNKENGCIDDFHDLDRNVHLVREFLPFAYEWNAAEHTESINDVAAIFLKKSGEMQIGRSINFFKSLFSQNTETFDSEKLLSGLRDYLYGVRLSFYGRTLKEHIYVDESKLKLEKVFDEILPACSFSEEEFNKLDFCLNNALTCLGKIERTYIENQSANAFEKSLEIIESFIAEVQEQGFQLTEEVPINMLETPKESAINASCPLYLAMTTAQFKESKDPSVHYDTANHAYYVDKTEANIQKYKDFLPNKDNTKRIVDVPAENSITAKIIGHLRDYGYSEKIIKSFSLDDKWYYDKENGKNSRSFRIINPYSDSPLLVLHSFKDSSLCAKIPLGKFDRNELSASIREQKKRARFEEIAELQNRIDKGYELSEKINLLKPVNSSFGYIKKKSLNPKKMKTGIFYDPDGSFTALFNPRLSKLNKDLYKDLVYIPLFNANGQLLNFQQINAEGDKRFINGATTKGLFAVIGSYSDLEKCSNVYVTEGVATAVSVAETLKDSNTCVIAALTAGNLNSVVQSLGERFPLKNYAIMADLDVMTAAKPLIIQGKDTGKYYQNPGVYAAYETKAQMEYELHNIDICLPPLLRRLLSEKKSDFNDCMTATPDICKERLQKFNMHMDIVRENKQKAIAYYQENFTEQRKNYMDKLYKQFLHNEVFRNREPVTLSNIQENYQRT